MWFGNPLYRLIYCIIAAPPDLGPAFLNTVDLADVYMGIWIRLEDIPSVAFLVPKATPEEYQLVGVHLSMSKRYVEYSAFFCATTDTVKDRRLKTLPQRNTAPPHPL